MGDFSGMWEKAFGALLAKPFTFQIHFLSTAILEEILGFSSSLPEAPEAITLIFRFLALLQFNK